MVIRVHYMKAGQGPFPFELPNVYEIESDGTRMHVRYYHLGDTLVTFQMARVRLIERID